MRVLEVEIAQLERKFIGLISTLKNNLRESYSSEYAY